MKSLLVSLVGTVPNELRDWVRQGSTIVEVATGPDAAHSVDPTIDRIVVWSDVDGMMPHGVDRLEPRRVFFVSPTPQSHPPRLQPDQIFAWPDDRDKLRMILTVGNG